MPGNHKSQSTNEEIASSIPIVGIPSCGWIIIESLSALIFTPKQLSAVSAQHTN